VSLTICRKFKTSNKEKVFKLFETMAVATHLYWRENWNVQTNLKGRIDVEERKDFRSVAECALHNKKKNK